MTTLSNTGENTMGQRRAASRSCFYEAPRGSPLAAACWLALVSVATPAFAQDGPADQASAQPASAQAQPSQTPTAEEVDTLQTVRVTGIRRSIMSSVNTKESSDSIVEAISAEDIGKLPDVSIADSISRLPGLATQRVDGRAQVINGREQVSTGDSRGVEFDQYPAELMNAVVVYKTPDASLVGQGLSGTVDLQTIRPLSLREQRIVFSGQGESNSLGDLTAGGQDKGYRIAASYVDQFMDNRLGVALGVARLNSPFQEEHYKEWWWASGTTTDGWGGAQQPGKPDDAIALQGSEGWVKSRDLTRDGLMGVLEFKPNDTWHSILDLYYSKFEQDELMRGTMWSNDPFFTNSEGGHVDYANVGLTEKDGYSFVTSGTLTGVQPIVRNDSNLRDDKLYAAGWRNTLSWDPWTMNIDLSYSKAEREQSTLETYAGLLGPQNIDFEIPLSNKFGRYALPDLSDPGTVYLWDPQNYNHDGRMENSEQTDTLKSARIEFNRAIASSDFLRSYQGEGRAGVLRRSAQRARADVGRSLAAGGSHFAGFPRHRRRAELRPAGTARPLLQRVPQREQRRCAEGFPGRGRHPHLLLQGEPGHGRHRYAPAARQRRLPVHPHRPVIHGVQRQQRRRRGQPDSRGELRRHPSQSEPDRRLR
jgi:iron complex outermembrane receptor protein